MLPCRPLSCDDCHQQVKLNKGKTWEKISTLKVVFQEAIPRSNVLNNPAIRGCLEKGVSVLPTSSWNCDLAASHLAETQVSGGASCPFLTLWFP